MKKTNGLYLTWPQTFGLSAGFAACLVTCALLDAWLQPRWLGELASCVLAAVATVALLFGYVYYSVDNVVD